MLDFNTVAKNTCSIEKNHNVCVQNIKDSATLSTLTDRIGLYLVCLLKKNTYHFTSVIA